MVSPENKIIIVDDRADHLQKLGEQFFSNGIGCTLCEYDSFFETPYSNVRIAFFDVNLIPSGTDGNDSLILSKLAQALKQYIAKDNGPYALIFWTSNVSLIENFKGYINERHSNFQKPFLVDCIDKDVFLNDGVKLNEKLRQVFSNESIALLLDFEASVLSAATKTINQIFEIIPQADKWGETAIFQQNFEKIFSNIASHTFGFENAKTNPDQAVYDALIPLLSYNVLADNHGSKWSEYLTTLKNAKKQSEIEVPAGFKGSYLNTVFHIDKKDLPFPLNIRGAVMELENKAEFLKTIFKEEFDLWFNALIHIKDSSQRKKTRLASKLIAVEISSACDYSQNKPRLNKYILGVIIAPVKNEDLAIKPESALCIGNFFINGEELQIWINLNYVWGTYPTDTNLGKPIFILKKEMMDMIGNRYANHVSRIGITSF